jgi:hypothetical protein
VRRDQGAALERCAQVDVRDLAGGLLGDDEVAAVECSSEDGARLTLGGDGVAPSRGRGEQRQTTDLATVPTPPALG